MCQLALEIPLSDFEQATLEQLVSFKAKKDKDIARLMNCKKLKQEVIEMVAKWDLQRISMNLEVFNK